MTTFNPDFDDLFTWFYVCFTEEYNSYSSDDEQEHLKHLKSAVLGKTDRFKDWCIEQMELANENISKTFRMAVINSIDIDSLMENLNNWVEEHVCDTCVRSMTYCPCEEDEEDEEEDNGFRPCKGCERDIIPTYSCYTCQECQLQLGYCTTCLAKCPHAETPPTSESDQEDSKNAQDHSHLLETGLATLVISPA